MTTFNKPNIISNFKAGYDLSADSNKYVAVTFDSNGDIIRCTSGIALGFLFNLPAQGEAAEVATIGGGALGIAGGTYTAGTLVKVDYYGKLIAATTYDFASARLMTSCVYGDVVSVQPLVCKGA
jgi:hypothetical protein